MGIFVPGPSHYNKPFRSLSDQISLLEQRGLAIEDRGYALSCLERIGYYRLSGYWYPFRKSHLSVNPVTGVALPHPRTGRPVTVIEDDFRSGSDFQQVMELYVFDKRLRLIFLDAIERIEVALRVEIALLLGARSPLAHRDPAQLSPAFLPRHASWLAKIDRSFDRSTDDFVRHFKAKYQNQQLPIWISIELWDFGTLSHLFSGLKTSDQTILSAKYNISRPALLVSFLRNINHIRNICAHHSRLWNRSPADRIALPMRGELPSLDHLIGDRNAHSRIYATACVMQHLLSFINPATQWPARLAQHLRTLPTRNGMNLKQAGFPDSWHGEPLWRCPSADKARHEGISSLAYCLWQARAQGSGDAEGDWYVAERQLPF